jgi:hypothetical protein
VYVVACLSIAYRGSHHLFIPRLQCCRWHAMQLIHFWLVYFLDDVSVVVVVCFLLLLRGISVSCTAVGCSDDVSVFSLLQW